MTPVLSARQALGSPLAPHTRYSSTAIPNGRSSRSSCKTRGRRPNVIGVVGIQTFANSYGSAMRISSKKEAAGAGPIGNMNGDLDDELDKLLDEYGEIVFTNPNQRPPSAEADDDAESLSLAVALAKAANDVKAADIQVLCVKPLVYWTRFFIIATAFSRPQIDAIGSKIRDIAEVQFNKFPTGDLKPNSWTLLDFGDVVVHIFLPQQRAFYNLEEFYETKNDDDNRSNTYKECQSNLLRKFASITTSIEKGQNWPSIYISQVVLVVQPPATNPGYKSQDHSNLLP